MNVDMAYLLGLVIGNGEIQRGNQQTSVSVEIPHKNLKTDDDGKDVKVYVKASIVDIRAIVEPLVGHSLKVSQQRQETTISFALDNSAYAMREILRLTGGGVRHSTMRMHRDMFSFTADEKKALLRGVADTTGYIRRSNVAYGQDGAHRVYIEIPGNWHMVIDIANMLKSVDVPVQTIDFGHPNMRDGNLKKFKSGCRNFWKKEHQVKIWANEFLPIGFNIAHKQEALEKLSDELLDFLDPAKTHKFYWEKPIRRTIREKHPGENDPSLPAEIRGRHFESWADIAEALGYGK